MPQPGCIMLPKATNCSGLAADTAPTLKNETALNTWNWKCDSPIPRFPPLTSFAPCLMRVLRRIIRMAGSRLSEAAPSCNIRKVGRQMGFRVEGLGFRRPQSESCIQCCDHSIMMAAAPHRVDVVSVAKKTAGESMSWHLQKLNTT